LVAAALWTAPSAAAQVEIDTSSPESVMASLAELHESWTLIQFTEFLRAALIAQLPDEVENPASLQERRNRWEFLEDVLALWAGLSIEQPLVHERDSFALDVDTAAPWLQQSLSRALQGRTIDEVMSLGRDREHIILVRLRERYEGWSRELQDEIEDAQVRVSGAGASRHDRRQLETLQRRLVDFSTTLGRLDRRREAIEGMGLFVPGAVGCILERGIDRSTEQAMMADLDALADACPQKDLIRFLRASAFVSEVPAGLAEPGARMEARALRGAENDLSLAIRAIAGLAAVLQKDPLIRGTDSVPARLKAILDRALDGRTIPEVVSEGEKLERAFLMALRADRSAQLRSEIEKRRRQALGENALPERSSGQIKQLRVDIERLDRRLAMLGAEAPTTPPPGAN
jgi:hypothetical protein